jgi:Uma2 family endonuclease
MSAPAGQRLTEEEYLAIERAAEFRSEFFAGQMFAMAGGSEAHNLIVGNVIGELRSQLKGRQVKTGPPAGAVFAPRRGFDPCRVYPSDMKVKVTDTGLYTYPDVTVVCGERHFEGERTDILLNPTLIVEVLSQTTEAYDRGDKFAHYRQLESLQEYVLIAQDRQRIERYVRQAGSREWLYAECSDPLGTVPLTSIGCELALAEVYDKVELPEVGGASEQSQAERPR